MKTVKNTQKPVLSLKRFAFKKLGLLASAILYAGTVLANNSIDIDLPAQSLDQSLHTLAKQTGAQILFSNNIASSKKVKSLKGQLTVKQALQQLLQGTGLEIKQNGENSYSVVPAAQYQSHNIGQSNTTDVNTNRSANSNITQLPVITVNAEQNGSVEDGYLVRNITGAGIWGERSLQDTPYSMSIISGDLIENVQAKDMNQIFKMNATTQDIGHAFNGNGDSVFPTMRGFAVRNPIINGVSYAHSRATTPMMQDLERLEIISGATGFLYGGGRVGGAINYITKKPTIENLRNITVGSYGNQSYYGHIDLGGQFDQNSIFGYRINAFYQDGELQNTSETEQKNISLVFDWKPAENFYTDIKYFHKDSLTKGANTYFNVGVNGFDRASIKENKNYSPDWIINEIKSDRIENSVKYKINDVLTLRTNILYEEMDYSTDYSYLFVQNGSVIKGGDSYFTKNAWQNTKNYGANIYVDSSFDIQGVHHTLTTGYSFSSNKYSQPTDRNSRLAYYDLTENISLNELKNVMQPDWGNTLGIQSPTPNSKLQFKNILIGDDIIFNKQWNALVGFNYATTINKSYISNTKYGKSKLTPTLSLIYKPFDQLTTYATYIESLEAGALVGTRYKNSGKILAPYISKQYEIGTKYSLLRDKALLTASLFRIEKADQFEDKSTTPSTLTQDGEQIHQGIELGLTGKVTDNLTLIGGMTFMDLSVEKATNPNFEGKKPTNAPQKMAKIFTEYQIPNLEGLYLSAGAYYTGKRYYDRANTDILSSYILYDVGLRYNTKLGQYPTTFNITGQNLTDKVYWRNGEQLGDPRTVAFSVKTQF